MMKIALFFSRSLQTSEAVPADEVRETGAKNRFRFGAKIWINENSETDKNRESRDIACILEEQATGVFAVRSQFVCLFFKLSPDKDYLCTSVCVRLRCYMFS